MKDWLLQIFTWWSGQTIGTRLYTWRNGELVGTDQFGNRYYRTKSGVIDPTLGVERRWVIYASVVDSTLIPPGWFGWMHHRTDTAPNVDGYVAREWEMPHRANPTGSADAYRPRGSIVLEGNRAKAAGDYKAWRPE